MKTVSNLSENVTNATNEGLSGITDLNIWPLVQWF